MVVALSKGARSTEDDPHAYDFGGRCWPPMSWRIMARSLPQAGATGRNTDRITCLSPLVPNLPMVPKGMRQNDTMATKLSWIGDLMQRHPVDRGPGPRRADFDRPCDHPGHARILLPRRVAEVRPHPLARLPESSRARTARSKRVRSSATRCARSASCSKAWPRCGWSPRRCCHISSASPTTPSSR